MSTLYDIALSYWQAGLCPLPRIGLDPTPTFRLAHGGTEAIPWGQYKVKQPERALVAQWFRYSDSQRDGLLLLPGSDAHPRSQDPSFLQILDIERADLLEAFLEEL